MTLDIPAGNDLGYIMFPEDGKRVDLYEVEWNRDRIEDIMSGEKSGLAYEGNPILISDEVAVEILERLPADNEASKRKIVEGVEEGVFPKCKGNHLYMPWRSKATNFKDVRMIDMVLAGRFEEMWEIILDREGGNGE